MTALELHRQYPNLELAPVLRVIKYMGLDSSALSAGDVERILKLYPHFECDPELVVGHEAVCRETGLEPERLQEILENHRPDIPYLGSAGHPMMPLIALRMIRAITDGDDPFEETEKKLYTLTAMAEKTDISLASLSKYVKEQPERIPSELVGKMRKFPSEAIGIFKQIKMENLGKRGSGDRGAERHKAAVSRRFALRFADLEEQLDAAFEVSKALAKTLNRLARQVRRARAAAESGAKLTTATKSRGRRSGVRRPDTIVAACKRVLAEAGEPMRVADITERVIELGANIRAKNPNVTVSSILSSYEDFSRVKRGSYQLAPGAEYQVRGSTESTDAEELPSVGVGSLGTTS